MTIKYSAPTNEAELLKRAWAIAGLTFAEVAEVFQLIVPESLNRYKGWVGHLIEIALGATAGSKAERDFQSLGIELKTLPIDKNGKILETTFVSLAPLTQTTGLIWETSHVRYKLAKVLWIPVEGSRDVPLALRRIGSPILWQPNAEQERLLKRDWEELMDYIILGRVQEIDATLGEVLQLRPKAANSRALTTGINERGETIKTLPLGFYLRKQFTQMILQNYLER